MSTLIKPFDHELYGKVCTLTQALAKKMGILWEEEQAEIAYEIITNDYSKELGLDEEGLRESEYKKTITELSNW